MLSDLNVCPSIGVKDLTVARKFYEEKLGLKATMEDQGGIFYRSGNSGIFIYPTEFAGTNKATYAAWSTKDVEGVVAELKSKGIEFEHYDFPGVKREGDVHVMGELKSAWFKDPDGNTLNIVNQGA